MKKYDQEILDEVDQMNVDMPKLSEEKLKRIHKLELKKIGVDNMKKNNKKNVSNFRRGLVAACLIVAVGAGVPNVMSRINSGEGNTVSETSKGGEIKIITELKEGEFASSVKLSNGVLNFGDSREGMASQLYFDPAKTKERTMSLEEYIEYMGVDPRASYIPDGLEGNSKAEFIVIENNDGTMAYDNHVFWYQGAEHGNFLRIVTSKGELPLNCVGVSTDGGGTSNINGTEISVGHRANSIYSAKFIYNGVGYEIGSSEVSQEEFIKVLASIIK